MSIAYQPSAEAVQQALPTAEVSGESSKHRLERWIASTLKDHMMQTRRLECVDDPAHLKIVRVHSDQSSKSNANVLTRVLFLDLMAVCFIKTSVLF